ncbi:MAG TPA: GtrA family protein [Syntrophomonas sp.]|jgi:putative flippase GtrA|nr:GtrA family protein [Syntrophomonas sp.]
MKKYHRGLQNKYLTIFLEMAQYGLVSVSALAVDVGLLYVLVEYAAFHHIHAATISFTCGLAVNYILARLFVFKESKFPLLQEFIWYASIGVVGLLLNDFIIYLLVWLGVWYLYAKAVSVAVVFFFNFFGRRRLFVYQ